jgi:hypothetical protein
MFDLLGYDANVWKHYNKINIHVGGTYGDKGTVLIDHQIGFTPPYAFDKLLYH